MLSRRVIHFYKKNFEIVIAVVYWSCFGARDDTGQIKIHEPKYGGVIVNKTEIKKSIRDILGDWVTQVRRSQPADHSETGCAAVSPNGEADSVRWYERCQSIWDH